MKLYGGFPMPPGGLLSRMHVLLSVWTLPQMTYHLCLLVLSSLTVSSQLGLEDVFFSPLDQTVKEGEGVFLQCVSGESSPPASITWLKDGNVVTRGRQIQGEYGGGSQRKTSGTLHLSNVTLQDDGMYICVTFNPSLNISKWSKPAKLNVQGVPRRLHIIKGPDNITVAMGTEIYMHCAVHGFPVPMVHWFKDDCLLMNCSTSFSLQNNGQLLTFRNVTKEDEGFYHCEASNQEETIRSNSAFLLPAEMDWSFVQQPTNQTVRRGQNVTVTCSPPYSRPPAQVSWFRNNQLLTPTTRIIVLPSGDLFLHHVQESDSGRYFCRASNVHLQRFLTSRRATLTVQAPPSVKLLPQVLTVPLGARVMLHCQVSGHPLPSITWVKRGQTKQTGGKVTVGLRNATLHIQSARSYDEGVYACEASNPLGHSRGTAMLTVAVSPIIVTFANQVNVKLGASAVLPCKAVGILPIMYSWSRGRTQLHSVSATSDNDGGTLSISIVQWTDAGEYYCTAENRAGRHQRRTVLTVTVEDHPGDRGKQTRLVLSANTNPSREAPISPPSGAVVEQHGKQKHPLHVQAQHRDPMCFTAHCDTKTGTFSPFSSDTAAESTNPMDAPATNQLDPPTTSPSQPLVTQMQPPMLLPPPHPNFQSVALPVTSDPLSFSNSEPTTESHIQSPLTQFRVRKIASTKSAFPGVGASDQITKPFLKASQLSHLSSVTDNKGSYLPNQASPHFTHLPTVSTLSSTAPLQLTTQNSETNVGQIGSTPQHLPLPPTKQISQSYPQQSFTQRFLPKFHLELHLPSVPSSSIANSEYRTYSQPSATVQTPSTASPRTQLLSTSRPRLSSQRPTPQTQSFTLQKTHLPKFHPPVTDSPDQVSVPSPPNATKGHPPHSTKSTNDSELTELKKNTSQSPMTSNDPRVTQQSPSWLPILEKHDIPIVVGVGVSLAFIFITVTFYSVVQKNEPAPTSRAAQRNLGVPMRHAERRAAGRTYENRAFEDDECMAVIEQSPNISDTRARPPGPSLVTVRLEPTSENLQEEMQPTLDQHSVTVETYPEPILDTKIDPSLDEDKGRSLSQPSIQLHCTEDWPSNGGDNHSPCHDALPPPSSLPSCSPSPSPPSRRGEGLRSSVTLQSTEPFVAPIHHSLNISHGNPPLLLSHHVSLGPTTVAVDVHFYPTATTSMAVGTTTHINSVSTSTSAAAPLFGPPFTNSQVNDQSAPTLHQCK